ncbi:MAG: hypothetical protein QNJ46_01385 [Leptolyngbyaceae cyanobacterium MO_188.B28]|nr:hypothetical protein [Leptolyngbyaceae cyanobacterium MO_188.B28]
MCQTYSGTVHQTIDNFLTIAQIAIDDALNNPRVLAALERQGYTRDRIRSGKTLYENALTAHRWRKAVHNDQMRTAAALNQAWKISQKSHRQLVKAARLRFKSDLGVTTRLNLNSRGKRSLSSQLLHAQQLYTNLLNSPELMDALQPSGITPAKLKIAQAEIEIVQTAHLVNAKEKLTAQAAAKARNAAINTLRAWLSDFIHIARIALRKNPELLESTVFATLPDSPFEWNRYQFMGEKVRQLESVRK